MNPALKMNPIHLGMLDDLRSANSVCETLAREMILVELDYIQEKIDIRQKIGMLEFIKNERAVELCQTKEDLDRVQYMCDMLISNTQ